jgi:hypothetical protein
MDKKLIVGGLAVVGAIALFMYLKPKPRTNSDGFFNAQGMSRFFQQTSDRNKSQFQNASGLSSFFQQTSDRNKSQFKNGNGKTVSAFYKR